MFDQRRFGDPRELRNRRLERREMELRLRVAKNTHVINGRQPIVIERLPDSQAFKQRLRTGGKRVNACIEKRIGRTRRGGLRDQGDTQSVLCERERGAFADEAAADDGDVKRLMMGGHGRIISALGCAAGRGGKLGRAAGHSFLG